MRITAEHSGRLGTITRGESRMRVQIVSVDTFVERFYVTIEGTSAGPIPLLSAEWDFEPEPSKIPEAVGLYGMWDEGGNFLGTFRIAYVNDMYPTLSSGSRPGSRAVTRGTLENKLGTVHEIAPLEKVTA